ncbi:MAG: hypothetical protein DHS20C07_13210 [Methyloligella sp.]|nr:MAG: hypothetical protein DHS20C07_13210 [Methyloligella sp.]
MFLRTAKAINILAGLALVLAALSLTACGVKGPLEAPPEAQTEGDAPVVKEEKPHRGFILDGLLN